MSMIERVAMALYKHAGYANWQGLGEMYKDAYRREARAAIKEMDQPTDAMVDAGMPSKDACASMIEDIYREMIAAALSETTEDAYP